MVRCLHGGDAPVPVSPLAILGAIALALGVMGLEGFAIHSLRGQVAGLKTENGELRARVTEQNDALEDIRDAASKREKEAKAALETARAAARAGEAKAQRLLATQLKPGEDPCRAADALISEALWGQVP